MCCKMSPCSFEPLPRTASATLRPTRRTSELLSRRRASSSAACSLVPRPTARSASAREGARCDRPSVRFTNTWLTISCTASLSAASANGRPVRIRLSAATACSSELPSSSHAEVVAGATSALAKKSRGEAAPRALPLAPGTRLMTAATVAMIATTRHVPDVAHLLPACLLEGSSVVGKVVLGVASLADPAPSSNKADSARVPFEA
mmetsp:Transcript_39557/g.113244  ORF Transcript_39557/g.113244 Transcript_39557/m.113244 type:complete len:205 (+) Transcript_39557:302-916(+)